MSQTLNLLNDVVNNLGYMYFDSRRTAWFVKHDDVMIMKEEVRRCEKRLCTWWNNCHHLWRAVVYHMSYSSSESLFGRFCSLESILQKIVICQSQYKRHSDHRSIVMCCFQFSFHADMSQAGQLRFVIKIILYCNCRELGHLADWLIDLSCKIPRVCLI